MKDIYQHPGGDEQKWGGMLYLSIHAICVRIDKKGTVEQKVDKHGLGREGMEKLTKSVLASFVGDFF